eukprot:6205247-Pyramimonas_sp.AAC.1
MAFDVSADIRSLGNTILMSTSVVFEGDFQNNGVHPVIGDHYLNVHTHVVRPSKHPKADIRTLCIPYTLCAFDFINTPGGHPDIREHYLNVHTSLFQGSFWAPPDIRSTLSGH